MEDKNERIYFNGCSASLPIDKADKVVVKFVMLLEGSCMGLGPTKAAAKY